MPLAVLLDFNKLLAYSMGQNQKELFRLLGPASAPWLAKAEINAWMPDLNHKAQAYFIVCAMTEAEFREWSEATHLTISEAASAPSGVWVLPSDVKPSRWLSAIALETPILDASGVTETMTLWSRWADGFSYAVVYPFY